MEVTPMKKVEEAGLRLVELIKTVVVKNDSTLKRANSALLYIKRIRKEISDFCDPNIDRLNKAHKEALAQKRKFEEPFILAEKYIKPQVASYLTKLAKERYEAERKERDRIITEKSFGLEPTKPAVIPIKEKPKLKGVSVKKIWKFRVTNKNIIPAEYWMLDVVKIGKVGRESKGQAIIAGVEFYSEPVVLTRDTI